MSEKLRELDQKIAIRCNHVGGKCIIKTVALLLGNEKCVAALVLFLIFYNIMYSIYIGCAYFLGFLLILSLKHITHRERPYQQLDKITLFGKKMYTSSFPSWDAYNVTSVYLTFAFLSKSWIVILLAITFICLVCFSRVQIGVHYPSDVLAGAGIGIMGFILSIFLISPFLTELIL